MLGVTEVYTPFNRFEMLSILLCYTTFMQQVLKGGKPSISKETQELVTKEFADLENLFWEGVTWTFSKRGDRCEMKAEFYGQTMNRAFFLNDGSGRSEEQQYQEQMKRVVDDIFERLKADKHFRALLQNNIQKQYDTIRVGNSTHLIK